MTDKKVGGAMTYLTREGRHYVFENTEGEADRMFYDRCAFRVANGLGPEVEALSHIWVQKKYIGVTYSAEVEKRLEACKLPWAPLTT